jgi:CRP/FNR family transcriptional regulator, cyclic AMP receptor protein
LGADKEYTGNRQCGKQTDGTDRERGHRDLQVGIEPSSLTVPTIHLPLARFRRTRIVRCVELPTEPACTLSTVARYPDGSPFAAIGQERRYRKGSTVMLQGDPVSTVHMILEGWVKVVLTTPSGREVVVALLGPDDLLGHFEAFEGTGVRHRASVIALDDARTAAIPAGRFIEYLHDHPDVALEQLRQLVELLCRAEGSRLETALLDTTHRVASLLVDLADRRSETTPEGVVLGVSLSQEEMSTMIGASRDSVARALTSLRSRNMVRTGRRTITILDLDAVRTLASEML